MSLESRLKSAVNALEKPFKGIIPENLMPEHSKWEPDQSSEDDPTPSPEPEPELPDQDPLPSKTQAIHSPGVDYGNFIVYGMENAGVSVTYNGEEIASGIIDTAVVAPDTQEPTGEYYYFNNAVVGMPAAGETVTVTVTMSGYADWSTTVEVRGGK